MSKRTEKLERVMAGCRFRFTGDRMERVYVVGRPGGVIQDVHRDRQGTLIYEGWVNQMASRGNCLSVGQTLMGQHVQVLIDVDKIELL